MNAMGDNSALTDAESRALFMKHLFACRGARDSKKEAQQAEKKVRGYAKADGIKLTLLDHALRAGELEDSQIIIDEQREIERINRWLGLSPGSQPDMFDSAPIDREPLVDRAAREGYAAGYAAGAAGRGNREAPFPIDTEAAQAWLRQYDEGRTASTQALQTALEKTELARKAKGGDDDGYVDDEDEGDPGGNGDAR